MTAWLRRLHVWLFGRWSRAPSVGEPSPSVTPARQRDAREVEAGGRWYFKRDILERLDDYFEVMDRFKAAAPDDYDFFHHVGVMIQNQRVKLADEDLDRLVPNKLGFGSSFFSHGDLGEKKTPGLMDAQFIYFRKMGRLPHSVQACRAGTVYAVAALYEGDEFWPEVAHIVVADDGRLGMLKELHQDRQNLPRGGQISHQRWRVPTWAKYGARLHECEPEEYIGRIFKGCYIEYLNASLDLRVRVQKAHRVASFTLDTFRTPYFFKDRDMVRTPSGARKRIWHMVRVHKRETKRGTVFVRAHFRGARTFFWNGYHITLSMPGREHTDLLDFECAAAGIDADELAPPGTISNKEAGRMVDKALRASA
jgi:hypothetical protein